jgi:parvulin-like peptidyl-prolyl isomerase
MPRYFLKGLVVKNTDLKKINVSHILVDHKYEAEDLERWLKSGKDFADLARKYSRCSSAKNAGFLGEILLSKCDENFAIAASQLKTGEISKPVRTRFGYHLILKNA